MNWIKVCCKWVRGLREARPLLSGAMSAVFIGATIRIATDNAYTCHAYARPRLPSAVYRITSTIHTNRIGNKVNRGIKSIDN